ncbi:Prenyltransferase and squalene oxidase repeat protein [Rosistilla oblonga]|uniref:prenyltransferase/squalene oxidase repeat-containing protein n=1 Tax=Rosistilla oblonga TaxID=2527990 RepID=UPI00118B4742|nr:prenyltransferase/squalene oxidase repeat-containing protein [Rosistilla oblonga]QDV10715.1 Prenyltransferase and squalene oxidase repeat protein [Rosistilla oblonga]
MTYLEALTIRLAQGAAELPEAMRQRQGDWLLAQQRPDGGFAGREGGSDLYYTAFALRSLMILGLLDGEPADRAAEFLKQRLQGREAIIDLISLIMAAKMLEISSGIDVMQSANGGWQDAIAELLETLRREDGGYAKSPEGRAGSTYQTFLTLLCYELIERSPPEPRQIEAFIRGQAQVEGGFLEIRVGKRAGVNPTAAAIGALRVLQRLDEPTQLLTTEFLAEMQINDGGMTANTRIPIADLLSTCTAIVTLTDLQSLDQIDRAAATRYVHSMERPGGGFAGFEMDPAEDVEYTFYGLAACSLLSL